MARVTFRQRDSVRVDRLFLGHSVKGDTYYVDSVNGNDNNNGLDPRAALATIDAAINKTTANNGDIIVVLPGHAESIATAGGINADVAGISIIGMGSGEDRPVITFITAAGADMKVAAADILVSNLVFKCNILNQTIVLNVDAKNAVIEDCEFLDGGQKYLTGIDLNGGSANSVDGALIRGCRFFQVGNGGDRAIELGEIAAGVILEDNLVYGDWDNAGIHNVTGKVLTDLTIRRNDVRNLATGQHAIELISACTGVAISNHMFGNTLGTIFDPGSLFCVDNWEQDAIDEAGVVSPRTMNPAGLGDGAIAAATLASNALTAAKFAADAITNAKIADNAFSDEQFDVDSVGGFVLGKEVAKATTTLPQGVAVAQFTVAGGRVLVTSIVGEVTVQLGAVANNMKLISNPTVGSDVDLCAVLEVNGDVVGSMYTITGVLATALKVNTEAVVPAADTLPNPGLIIPAGTIDLSCSASTTGETKWTIHYIPLDAGATIVAA